MTLRYVRSMDSVSRTTCWLNTPATVCGSFDCGSACGVPLRPGDRLTVVPLMEVISPLPSHARKRSRSSVRAEYPEPIRAAGQGKKGMQGKETAGVLPLCGGHS